MVRKIIHIDMDAFFAAVEQRDFPQFRGQPLVVGGAPDSRGVVATCSYEARRYGIHSAMASSRARRLCPHAIFVKPRFEAYRRVSRQIQDIFTDFTEHVEPLSLDEAFLDVTGCRSHRGSATLIARDIKKRVRDQTGLTASAGVSYNKLFAKIASDLDKPDGLYLITPEQGPGFAARLPVGRIHGIGKATERRMAEQGIITGADLAARSLDELRVLFGKAARYYHDAAHGIDDRPVVSHRVRKSIGAETTFQRDLGEVGEMLAKLTALADTVANSLARRGLGARTVTIKVRYDDFQLCTRSLSLDQPLTCRQQIEPLLSRLLSRTEAGVRRVRLLGVSVSKLAKLVPRQEIVQLDLFQETSQSG